MDHSPFFLNYKRNIQTIIRVNFRLCALIQVGYVFKVKCSTAWYAALLGNLSVESCLKIRVYTQH